VDNADPKDVTTPGSRRFLGGVAIAVVGLGLSMQTGCGSQAPANAPAADAKATALEVVVCNPARETVTRLIEQPGYIKAFYETPIYSKIPGFALTPEHDIGDHVKEGTRLLRLYVPEMEADLKAKEARVKQAKAEVVLADESLNAAVANVDTAEAMVKEANAEVDAVEASCRRWDKELVRANDLLSKNLFDVQTRDEAVNQLEQAQANCVKAKAHVKSAIAALVESKARKNKAAADVEASRAKELVYESDKTSTEKMLDYRDIIAPYDGVVTLRHVNKGDFLQPSSSGNNKAAEPVFMMMKLDTVRVTVQVPEVDAKYVHKGLPATIRFPGLFDEEIKHTVERSTNSVDKLARTLVTEIWLEQRYKKETMTKGNETKEIDSEVFLPGMYANVTIEAKIPNALTLPKEAVLSDEGGRQFCFIVENGKAVRTELRVGVSGNRVVILNKVVRSSSGKVQKLLDFTGNEEVIAKNAGAIFDGQAVTPSLMSGSDSSAQK
jgi:multidrug efflux pump subunit AcrA (membrane-fusion protein)